MAKNTITTAGDKADLFNRLNATTKRINRVTNEPYETPRLRDILAEFTSPAPALIHHPATPPAPQPPKI